MKVCKQCGVAKPLAEYHEKRSICKDCYNAQQLEKRGRLKKKRTCMFCGCDITRLHYKRQSCDAPECQQKWKVEAHNRRLAYQRSHPKRKTGRKCIYCGADISKLHGLRKYCTKKECREKYFADLQQNKNEHLKKYRKEDPDRYTSPRRIHAKKRICRDCGKVITNGNWLRCDSCIYKRTKLKGRCDGDYNYWTASKVEDNELPTVIEECEQFYEMNYD